MTPPDQPTFELEAERERDESADTETTSVEFELEWDDSPDRVHDPRIVPG